MDARFRPVQRTIAIGSPLEKGDGGKMKLSHTTDTLTSTVASAGSAGGRAQSDSRKKATIVSLLKMLGCR